MENLLSSDSHLLAEAFKGFLSSSDEYAFVKDKNFVYHYGKNILRNVLMTLEGEVKDVDICMINNIPFIYFDIY